MALQRGQQFGRYELMFRVGHGSITETWRARQLEEDGSSRPVLFKKFLPECAQNPLFPTRFLSEAQTAATLIHGNIAQVYDYGWRGDRYFLAREYVDGQSLQALLQRARESGMWGLPVPLATFIAQEMCRGLHFAHTRTDEHGKPLGIVHGGLSLEQVLIGYDGQVKVVGFGMAGARELLGSRLEPGADEDRPLLISPEQAQGGTAWDARADVWATGIILFTMLRGEIPRMGETPWPRSVFRGVPEEFIPIVLRATAQQREERYDSCEALDQALTGGMGATASGSSVLLAHFVQELFREDLGIEGRSVNVPDAFLDQLAEWRGVPRASNRRKSSERSAPPTEGAPPTQPPQSSPVPRGLRAMKTRSLVGLAGLVALGAIIFIVALPRFSAVSEPPTELAYASGQPIDVDAAESNPPPSNVRMLSVSARTAFKNGYVSFQKKDYTMALTWALECIRLEPTHGDCLLLAGDTHSELGQRDRATQQYGRFLEVAPQHSAAGRVRRVLSASP